MLGALSMACLAPCAPYTKPVPVVSARAAVPIAPGALPTAPRPIVAADIGLVNEESTSAALWPAPASPARMPACKGDSVSPGGMSRACWNVDGLPVRAPTMEPGLTRPVLMRSHNDGG